MEGTSGAKRRRFERSEKKSKKRLKQKTLFETDKENAKGIHGLPDAADAVPSVTGCEVAQVCSGKNKEKKSKVLEDEEVRVRGSRERTQDHDKVMGLRENTQDNEHHGTLMKKKISRKSKVESSDMTSVEEKEVSGKDKTTVQGDGKIEDDDSKKPSDTTWVQTASWKFLVGETGRVTFSLGSMVRQDSDLRTGTKMSSTGIAPAQSSMEELSSNHVSSWIEDPSSAPRLAWSTMPWNGHLKSSHVEGTCKLTIKAQAESNVGD